MSLPERTPFGKRDKKEYCRQIDALLAAGVDICGRHYEYLFDKGNKVWALCPLKPSEKGPDELRSVEDFIKWVGCFDGIQSCKVADRIGLAFSRTFPVAKISRDSIHFIPDVIVEVNEEVDDGNIHVDKKSDDKKKGEEEEEEEVPAQQFRKRRYNFSDGIGYFGSDIAALLQQNVPRLTLVPAAIQIRMGGVKGVLSYNPDVRGIHIRRSMIKFRSSHTILEICRTSGPSKQVALNRELVQLLESLGASRDGIRQLQQEVLDILQAATSSTEGALTFLRRYRNSYPVTSILFKALVGGFSPEEPYISNMLTQLQKNRLAKIRYKAHIPIENGFFLMGILDEKGILAENEIYVQPRRGSPPLQGWMAVTTFPCNHPGDIRILKAVWKQEFAHLPEVIIFSRKGARPQTDKMSGHDLDGDYYWGTWDPKLFPQKEETPLSYGDYKHPAEVEVDPFPPVQQEEFTRMSEIRSYFSKFAILNELGVISNRRLALADRYGTLCKQAVSLALLQSNAVDARKLGKPQQCPLDEAYRVQTPYYLVASQQDGDIQPQPSQPWLPEIPSMLRILFDDASASAFKLNSIRQSTEITIDHDLQYPGYQDYMEEAHKLLVAFNKELFVCIAMGYPTEDVRKSFQRALYSGLIQRGSSTPIEECKKKASAWYLEAYNRAAHSNATSSLNNSESPRISFPWQTCCEWLVRLKEEETLKREIVDVCDRPLIDDGVLPRVGMFIAGGVEDLVAVKAHFRGNVRGGVSFRHADSTSSHNNHNKEHQAQLSTTLDTKGKEKETSTTIELADEELDFLMLEALDNIEATAASSASASSMTSSSSSTARIILDIYTDGHHKKGTSELGYGAFCKFNGKEYRMGGPSSPLLLKKEFDISPSLLVSNPTMEMVAVAMVLSEFQGMRVKIRIYADYEGVPMWVTKRWQAKKDHIIKVRDKIFQFRDSIVQAGGSVEVHKVEGHSGIYGNEEADKCSKFRKIVNEFSALVGSLGKEK